jgi:cytoskeletal protein CcmA (bactofilin family)
MPDSRGGRPAGEPERALLGAGSEFEGLLLLHGPARLEGRVRGEIVGTSLWIGPAASIDARVEAEYLVVSGEVAGSVHVSGRVELRASAHVSADLSAQSLVLEEGSFLEGRCTAGSRGPAARPPQPAALP